MAIRSQQRKPRRVGHYLSDTDNLLQAANCGEILGLALNGLITERLGYKKVVLGSLLVLAIMVSVSVTAKKVEHLLIYYLIAGIPWGIFQTCKLRGAVPILELTILLSDYHLRLGSHARGTPSIPHHLRQLLLGSRSSHRCRSCQVPARPH